MEIRQIDNILNKLKNKEDFKHIVINCDNAIITIEKEHIYFTQNNEYIIVVNYYNGTRKTTMTTKKQDIVKILKQFNFVDCSQ